MIKPLINVTYEHAPNKFFQRMISDNYYLRDKSTGMIYVEVVDISININNYEETNIQLPKDLKLLHKHFL